MQTPSFQQHHESTGTVAGTCDQVFVYLDDPKRLSAHMGKSSWMMGGGRMDAHLDAGGGQRIGSRIVLSGRAFGMAVELEEIIDERTPPTRKAWHTVGTPRLLVIGEYRMGCELAPQGDATVLRVFIDYNLPQRGRWLGRLLGGWYARWCTDRMLADVRTHFAALSGVR